MTIKTRLVLYFVAATLIAIALPSGLAIKNIRDNAVQEFKFLSSKKIELGSELVTDFFVDLLDDMNYFAGFTHVVAAQPKY